MAGDYNYESNIAKSINKYLKVNTFPTWNLTGNRKQFHSRYPTGEFHRPAVCIEYQHAKRSQRGSIAIGFISKLREFKITVFGPTAVGTSDKEEMLEQYKNQIEETLQDRNIPYLRFDHDDTNPPQVGVFNVDYIDDEITSELQQKDKNLWEINIEVK